jgi:GT2 family glycosyltransferase
MSNQVEALEQASQELRGTPTVLVFFTVFLTLILAAKALDLWAILIPELSRLFQYFMINIRPQMMLTARSEMEFLQNLTGQVLLRGELASLEVGSRPLPFGTKIKNILVIGACDISVIIPALNEEKYLPRCLESLSRQSRKEELEIIVVDGGSNDRTVEVAMQYAHKVIVKPSPVGVGRNIGAKRAEGKVLAFIDADTMACENWIEEIARTFDSSSNAAGVTGPTLPYEGTELDKLAYHVATGWAQRLSLKLGRPHVAGFNCAYRPGPFWDAGGFDENRVLSEDVTLSLKMRHQGPILFNPEMIAYTSLRRIKKYGYLYLTTYYAINAAMMLLFDRTLGYPQVR